MKNSKRKYIIVLCIILSILYMIFAFHPLNTEIHFVPVWAIDSSRTSFSKDEEIPEELYENAIPFKLGQTLGYFTDNGKILMSKTFPYKASITDSQYVMYGTDSAQMPFFNPKGEELGKINGYGFPYFSGDRKFLFLPGGSSFSKLGDDGSIQWTYEGYAPITAFSSSEKRSVVGLAEGNIISFTEDGEIDQEFKPVGSAYKVILGAAVSNNGEYVAAVSGQDEQRFILAEKVNGYMEVVFHKYLGSDSNRQLLVKFSRDENYIYFNYEGGIGIVNTKTHRFSQIPIKGHILSIKESEQNGIVFILSKNEKTYTVSAVELFDIFRGSFSFEADSAFIAVKDDSLFVGRDSRICKMTVTNK
ncbi:MAG: hypothetical protein II921_07760 [Treponema sp.]|nr:hypothetical protein [Treponema sp.]